ncbi:MAG: gamma-glutamyltransferase [Myxococcota bacterium]
MRWLLILVLGAACAPSHQPPVLAQPETSSGFRSVPRSTAKSFMVATANPVSTEIAAEVLRQGGTAMDAAVAAHMALTVVEPQSSGIGGGGFLLYYDAASKRFHAYDGRETAPMGMTPDVFLAGANPMKFMDAVIGGLSVGVPGAVAALERGHANFGALAWPRLVQPSADLARNGWRVHPRLANGLKTVPALKDYAGVDSMFFDREGNSHEVGTEVSNPALALTLDRIAEQRSKGLLSGETAERILSVVADANRPGRMTQKDMDAYQVVEREARCVAYRGHQVCAFPEPSGSLIAVTMLKLLERFDLAAMDPLSPRFLHLFAQASELAYADRDRYYADPAFVDVPVESLLEPARISDGSALIREDRRESEPLEMTVVPVERREHPVCVTKPDTAETDQEKPGTSHISIVDSAGNAVSFTASVENNFGSQTMAGGFVLNNQLTDFEFQPCDGGRLKANAPEPGKRPRSSMAPVIVLDSEGQVRLVVGSPGGAAIISYTAQTIIAVLDWGMNPQDAVALPHLIGRKGVTIIEDHPNLDSKTESDLTALGHTVKRFSLTSGLSVVERVDGGFAGGADPRRDGVAAGD